jgi:cell division protein FtsW (lipid II flippase)
MCLLLSIGFAILTRLSYARALRQFIIVAASLALALFAVIIAFRRLYRHINRLLLNNMCLLLGVSFAILTRLSYTRALRQFFIVVVSLALALLVPYLIRTFKDLYRLTWVYAGLGIVILAVVLLLGETVYGSKRVFAIGELTFQPSEIVKLLFVFFVAAALAQNISWWQQLVTMAVAGAHVIILVLSRDLGSALILFVVYLLMLFLATGKWWILPLGIAGGALASVVAYQIFAHVRNRVQAFLDPWSVIDNQGYQITQSLFSISSGGLFGMGLYRGKPNSIPFVEADFIFSALAEELGLMFAVCILLICLSCFIMFMSVAASLNDKFYQLVAVGMGVAYIFQCFLTVGGGTKFIPLTGLTLPLVSHGGTSVFMAIMMFAIVEGLYIVKADEAERRGIVERIDSSRNKRVVNEK